MNAGEFMNHLDSLYEAMDNLDEKLEFHTNGEAISECAHYILGHKIKALISKYFEFGRESQ